MATVHWSVKAHTELLALGDRIALISPLWATRLTNRIYAATERLEAFPRLGRVVPEYRREAVREVIVGSYRVLYLIDGDDVVMLAIEHARRDLIKALGSDPWSIT